jgi:hypothetical protein
VLKSAREFLRLFSPELLIAYTCQTVHALVYQQLIIMDDFWHNFFHASVSLNCALQVAHIFFLRFLGILLHGGVNGSIYF